MTSKVPCKFFLSGCCAYGDGCRFSHDGAGGGGGGGGAGVGVGGGGREVCKFFLAGNCAYGAQCRFEHSGAPHGGGGSGRRPPAGPHHGGGGRGGGGGGPPPPGMPAHGEWSGGVYKWPSGADEFGLLESMDPNPNWDDYMDPDEMEAFEEWQREQMEGGGGDEFLDPSDIPLCTEFEAGGACRGGDECPLIHGDPCESCGLFSIHPYNPDLIEAHKKKCKGKGGGGKAEAGGGMAEAGAGGSKAEATGAAGGKEERAAAAGGEAKAEAAADSKAAAAAEGKAEAAPAAGGEAKAEAAAGDAAAAAAADGAEELAAGLEKTKLDE
ncbi:MAG: hypothetical protein J3K34DRAFT_526124 [Monoraphidium minutum]|nr:MAG: hypothetical protein J3K34DRAFT_526124 [Monoraphidium minutum]